MSTALRHSIEVVAAAADIDEQDHVSNLVYLRWVLDAARAHSDARGWDRAAYLELGAAWFVRRHEIDYLRAARLGATITVTTWVESWKRASCVRCTEITSDGSLLARASTTWALVELASGRPTRVPEALQSRF
ncbi:MAG: acyl-CoA thioesterase [Deltaproteobacteria bacterium]|nr:acyl-CoA thioesterase [Nannocystaceae bacterium]